MTNIDVKESVIEDVNARLAELRRSFDAGVRCAPEADTQKAEEFLLFTLAEETYAYPVLRALEISPVPPIVPVPGLPPAVLGIVNSRGQILSVTAIHGQLGLMRGKSRPCNRIIVTKGLSLATGFLVDSVDRIVEIPVEDVQPPPSTMQSSKARLLVGQTYVDDRLVSLLDLRELCDLESLLVDRADTVGNIS